MNQKKIEEERRHQICCMHIQDRMLDGAERSVSASYPWRVAPIIC
jgi:hypothetical protein